MLYIEKIQGRSVSFIKNLLQIRHFTHYACRHMGPNIICLGLPSLSYNNGVVADVRNGTIYKLLKVKFSALCFLKKSVQLLHIATCSIFTLIIHS